MKPFIRKRGKWLHVVYFNKGSTKPIEKSLKIPNTKRGMAEAKLLLPDYEKKELKDYNPKGRIKLSEAFVAYKNEGGFKEGTYELRKIALQHFINACGDKVLMMITEEDGVLFNKSILNLSVNSRAIYSSELRAFFNDLIKSKMIKINPILVSKRKPKPVLTIPDDDFDKILTYLKFKHFEWYFLIVFLKYTGLRKIDVLSLTWDCIKLDEGIIDTESIKTSYHFRIPIAQPLKDLLLSFPPGKGRIFNLHKRLNFWNRVQKKLELKRHYTIHEIRKTFISNLLRAGIPLSMVAKLVGHKRVSTTYTYYTAFELQQMGKELDRVWENIGKNNGNLNGSANLQVINFRNLNNL